ncbi:lymphocyte antigen 6 complex locus protein G6d [Echinops telfairi]|uniref:Lymphocyte antigen 6 complex locus protein G6d n=1 Tax=Echinops telfairi TaxID=9371 RepID=A0AC55D8X6_ECHTE|nr:lymphocyte antigen 6 complex locus protein G6d [Echinops telfairi]
MSPHLVVILLGTLLGTALGNQIRCFHCESPGRSSCRDGAAGTTQGTASGEAGCGGSPLGQMKLPQNSSVTGIHRHPARVAAHHCNQVETKLVGDATSTTGKEGCSGDPCSGAIGSTVAPASFLAAAATAVALLLPRLWRG